MIPDRECINQALYIIDYEVFMPRFCDFAILVSAWNGDCQRQIL
jgi:hypothetical protein